MSQLFSIQIVEYNTVTSTLLISTKHMGVASNEAREAVASSLFWIMTVVSGVSAYDARLI